MDRQTGAATSQETRRTQIPANEMHVGGRGGASAAGESPAEVGSASDPGIWRQGRTYGDGAKGVSPVSLRHFYGYFSKGENLKHNWLFLQSVKMFPFLRV